MSKTKYTSDLKNWLGSVVNIVSPLESCIKANGDEVEFLNVTKSGAVLDHQEHPTVRLAKGCYLVIHQQEYAPGEVKQVRD